jgi:hypothetical protein
MMNDNSVLVPCENGLWHRKTLPPQPKEPTHPKPDPDIEARLSKFKSEVKEMVGRILQKESRAIAQERDEIEDEVVKSFKAVYGSLDQRLATYARRKDLQQITDLISAISASGGPDLDSMLTLTTKLKKELEADWLGKFLEFREELKWSVAEMAHTLEDKIFAWGEQLEAKLDGLRMALENLHVNVRAEMPQPQIDISIPEQVPPTVHVTPQITMPRRKVTTREIIYDQTSGRPKSLVDTEQFEEQPELEEGEKGGIHRTRGTVDSGGTYGSMFKKKPK